MRAGGAGSAAALRGTATESAEAKKIQTVIDALQFELDQLGQTEKGKLIMNDLRRAGITEASAEADAIIDLRLQIIKERADLDALTQSKKEAAPAGLFCREIH